MATITDKPVEQEKVTEFRLTAQDRCQTCGAQAYVEAIVNGSDLQYCAHHFAKYEVKLTAAASAIHDERSRLLNV